MTKKLKDFVKQNIAPASKFGTNPTDPWSTKANLSEGKLETYLKSRGINPEYVSKDQKIAHAKSNAFKTWLQNHQNEEVQLSEDTEHLTKSPTRKRLSDLRQKQSLHKEIGVAHTQPVKEEYGNENEEFEEEEFEDEEESEELEEALQPAETHPYEVHHKTKGLVGRYKTLKAASRAVDKHDNEYGGVIATYKYVGGKKTTNEAKSDYTLYHPTYSAAVQHARSKLQDKGLEIHDDDWFHHVNNGPKKPSPGDTNSLHIPLQKDGKESKKLAHIQVYNRGHEHGNSYELNMYHEEVEMTESRGHKTISTWLKNHELMKKAMTDSEKAVAHAHKGHDDHINDRVTDTLVGRVPGGKDNEHFSYKVDLKKEDADVTTDMLSGRVTGGKPNNFKSFKVKLRSASGGPAASGIKVSEEVEELDEASPEFIKSLKQRVSSAKADKYANKSKLLKHIGKGDSELYSKMSDTQKKLAKEDTFQDAKAATQTVGMEVESSKKKLIKSLVSKKKRMSEDMYDAEKEDKSVQTYGKKPKMEKAEKEESGVGEKKPQAVGVMSGGSTLTGEKRDTVEIDPMMRNRPGQPEIGKKKDDKKDDKKKDDKKQEAK